MKRQKDVIIYGIGQHADVVQYYFESNLKRNVIAFTIDFKCEAENKNNLPIVQLNDLELKYDKLSTEVFIAVGGIGLNLIRQYYFEKIKEMGFVMTNCISKSVKIPKNAKFGSNCFIDDHSRFSPFIEIGDNFSTFDTVVGHHSIINNNVTTIGCTIGANVNIGDNCFIGINASVNSGVNIGEFSLIDVGSIVKKDIPPYSVVSAAASDRRNIDARRVNLLGISYKHFKELKKIT
ncbi:MAG: acetyltransferase [Bacteroidota bacterium]